MAAASDDCPSPTLGDRWAALVESHDAGAGVRAQQPVAVHKIVLAGHGAARAGASDALRRFAEKLGLPVATTFHGKGIFPDDHPQALGAVGFMRHDYVNFGFDQADAIVSVDYELQEFDPMRINPNSDKKIIHIHRFPAEVDVDYEVDVGIQADIGHTLDAIASSIDGRYAPDPGVRRIRALIDAELERGRADERFLLSPARIVADTRAALGRSDITLVDTGALKMWMARLYPTYEPNTCLISNGLSTMAWTLPGGIAAKLARPQAKVLVATGDGAFMMNSQGIETALRERVPFVVLIWVDNA
jgi:acetolactate synthase-1/2/3 large subunit